MVNEREIWNVKVGSPVIVRLSIPDADLDVEKQASFTASIGFVDVVANASARRASGRKSPNPNNVLRPGFQATMTILPASSEAGGLKTSMIVSSPQSLRPSRPASAMSLVASLRWCSSTRRPIPMRRRPDLVVRRIEYQGIGSWVIKDPVGLKYHRLHAEQYCVLGLLDGTRNLEQIRDELLQSHPTLHVTLADVQRLLTDLHEKGLLQTLRFGQGAALLKHHRKQRRQQILERRPQCPVSSLARLGSGTDTDLAPRLSGVGFPALGRCSLRQPGRRVAARWS